MNNVTLAGYFKDYRTAKNNEEIVFFDLGVQQRTKPKEGEQYPPTDWITCKAFSAHANYIKQYCQKGDYFVIRGHLDVYNKVDDEGKLIDKVMSVCVDELSKITPDKNTNEQGNTSAATPPRNPSGTGQNLPPKMPPKMPNLPPRR